ncbi:MAG: DUF4142 domain-containing protein [Blastocatellia bacterium]
MMNNRMRYTCTLLAVLLPGLLAGACATRQNNNTGTSESPGAMSSPMAGATASPMMSPSPTGTMAALSAAGREFMMTAAQGGQMEVQLGQLATQKAANADVKQFGQRMVDDHTRANQQLMQLASQLNVSLPQELSSEGQQTMDRLSKLSGAAFDREYMSHMVKDHQKDVAEYERMVQQAENPDLKNYASTTLTTLRDHLQQAQEIAHKVGAK